MEFAIEIGKKARSGRIIVTLIAVIAVAGCRTVHLQKIYDAPLGYGSAELGVDEVDEAIWRAGRRQGWTIERIAPGRMRGTWRKYRHTAVVSITHDGKTVAIEYERSENLLDQGDRIHRNYGRVVLRFIGEIQEELRLEQ